MWARAGASLIRADVRLLPGNSGGPLITPTGQVLGVHDCALEACRAAGFEPVLGQPAPQIASILSLVAAELGFSLVPASMRQLAMERIVYKTLRGPQTSVAIAAGVLRGPLSPTAAAFIQLVRRLRDE